jgi:mannosyltransferase
MRATPAGQQGKATPAKDPEGSSVRSFEVAGASRGTGWLAAAARGAPVVAVSALMLWFGLWGLARGSAMGNDEVVSRYAAFLPLGQLVQLLRRVDIVHGLYYLLLHGWMVVGTSPAVLRVPSVIAMVAAAAMMVILARRLTGSGWAGLFSGLIMVTTPSISYYAQTARSYALVFACVLGETLVLLSALQAERDGAASGRVTRWWVIYGALATLSGYLNEMALLVLPAHAITVLLTRYGRRTVRHWAISSAIACALAAPVVVVSVLQRGSASWIGVPDLQQVDFLYQDYFGASSTVARLLVACAVVAVLPPGRWWRRRRGSTGAEPTPAAGTPAAGTPAAAWWSAGGIGVPSVAVPLLLVPAGLLLLESRVLPPLYQERYVQYGEAGVALLAGAGVYRIGRWLAGAVRRPELVLVPGLAVCLCTALLQLQVQHGYRTPASRSFNFGGPAFYVGSHARRGDGVLFMSSFYRKAELGYPEQFRDTSDFALAVSPVLAPYQGINKPLSAVIPLMLAHRRIWVIGYLPSPALPAGAMRQESQLLLQDFSQVKARSYRGMWLTLWVRR